MRSAAARSTGSSVRSSRAVEREWMVMPASARPAPDFLRKNLKRRRANASVTTLTTERPTSNEEWLAALRSTGPARLAAVDELHALLIRAARHEVSRRSAAF